MSLITHSQREDLDLSGLVGLDRIALDPPSARRRYSRIRVALPALTPPASETYERALNRQLRSSGSGVAVGTMLATTLAYIVYLATTGTSLSGSWDQLAIGSAMVLAGAALGKVVGLFYWNVVFRRTALRLRRLVASSQAGPEELPTDASRGGKFH